jgi:lipopolysaccharide biosynthesis glycosyltransferase
VIEKVSKSIREVLKEHHIEIIDIDFFKVMSQFTHNIELIELVLSKHYYGKYLVFNQKQFSKAIYLDTDLLLMDNVDHLFSLDFSENLVYMAYDMQLAVNKDNNPIVVFTKNGFNSGVIVYTPSETLYNSCYSKLLDLSIDQFKQLNTDQDILNSLIEERQIKCIALNPKYNIPPSVVYDMIVYKYIDKPYIIHYMLRPKPWDVLDCMAYGENNVFFNNTSRHLHKLWISTYNEMTEAHYFSTSGNNNLYAKEYHFGHFLKNNKGISVDIAPIPKGNPI